MNQQQVEKIASSIAPCGLVCALCSRYSELCAGCNNATDETEIPCGGCKQRRCSRQKGYEGCWECADPCTEGLFDTSRHSVRIPAFVQCVRTEGRQKLAEYLVQNEQRGIFYHTDEALFTGDYDACKTVEQVLNLLHGKQTHQQLFQERFHMENAIQAVLDLLDANGIFYQCVEHEPVYTIEDMLRLHLDEHGEIPKNLFLRNANGKQHYLVIVSKEKTVNLKALREVIGSTALSFASEERLQKHLGLSKGAVTPFGILNDLDCSVEVIVDEDLVDVPCLGFHPNRNTATVFLSYRDVERVIQLHGNSMRVVKIPAGE